MFLFLLTLNTLKYSDRLASRNVLGTGDTSMSYAAKKPPHAQPYEVFTPPQIDPKKQLSEFVIDPVSVGALDEKDMILNNQDEDQLQKIVNLDIPKDKIVEELEKNRERAPAYIENKMNDAIRNYYRLHPTGPPSGKFQAAQEGAEFAEHELRDYEEKLLRALHAIEDNERVQEYANRMADNYHAIHPEALQSELNRVANDAAIEKEQEIDTEREIHHDAETRAQEIYRENIARGVTDAEAADAADHVYESVQSHHQQAIDDMQRRQDSLMDRFHDMTDEDRKKLFKSYGTPQEHNVLDEIYQRHRQGQDEDLRDIVKHPDDLTNFTDHLMSQILSPEKLYDYLDSHKLPILSDDKISELENKYSPDTVDEIKREYLKLLQSSKNKMKDDPLRHYIDSGYLRSDLINEQSDILHNINKKGGDLNDRINELFKKKEELGLLEMPMLSDQAIDYGNDQGLRYFEETGDLKTSHKLAKDAAEQYDRDLQKHEDNVNSRKASSDIYEAQSIIDNALPYVNSKDSHTLIESERAKVREEGITLANEAQDEMKTVDELNAEIAQLKRKQATHALKAEEAAIKSEIAAKNADIADDISRQKDIIKTHDLMQKTPEERRDELGIKEVIEDDKGEVKIKDGMMKFPLKTFKEIQEVENADLLEAQNELKEELRNKVTDREFDTPLNVIKGKDGYLNLGENAEELEVLKGSVVFPASAKDAMEARGIDTSHMIETINSGEVSSMANGLPYYKSTVEGMSMDLPNPENQTPMPILKGKDGKVIDATFASELMIDEGQVKMEPWKEYATGIRPVVKVPIQRERQFTAEEIEELEQIEKAMEELKNMEMEIIVNPDGQEIVKMTKPFSSSPTYMTMEEAQQLESFGVKKPKPIKFDISDEIDIAAQEDKRTYEALQEEGVEESNALTGMENVEMTASQTPASKLRKLFGASKAEIKQMQGGGYMTTEETTTSGGQKRPQGGYMSTEETTTSGGQKRRQGGYMSTEETTTSGGQRRPQGGYMTTEETTTSGGQKRSQGGYMTTEETVTEMGRRKPSGGTMVTEETTYSMDGKTERQMSNETIDKMKSGMKNPEKHIIFQLKPNHTIKSISQAFNEKTVGLFDEERKAFREIKKDIPNIAKTMKTDEQQLTKTLAQLPVAIFNEMKDRMKRVPGQKKEPNMLLDPVNWDEKKTNAYLKAFVPDDFKRSVLENRIKQALKNAGVPDNTNKPLSSANIVGVTTPKAGYNDTFEIHRAPTGQGVKDVSPEVIQKLMQNQNPNQTINSVNRFSGPVGGSTFK